MISEAYSIHHKVFIQLTCWSRQSTMSMFLS